MAHLTPERLVDLAEGTELERAVPHLGECEVCRRALAELRATIADAAGPVIPVINDITDVPEPAPLFWDQLSARVRDAVEEEEQGTPDASWAERWLRPRVSLPILAAVAGVVIVAVVASRRPGAPNLLPAVPLPIAENAQLPSLPPLEPLGASDDPSLGLLADYGTTLEWDDMRAGMALATHVGGSDEVVIALSTEERQELQRLLEEEMTQPSALGAS